MRHAVFSTLAVFAVLLSPLAARAQGTSPDQRETEGSQPWLDDLTAEERRSEEAAERQQAQYARNLYALQIAFGRELVKTTEDIDGYSTRVEFAMLIPTQDGASPLWVLHAGLSTWWTGQETRNDENQWGFGVPMGFGYGYRTPWLIGYGGLSFGLGVDEGAEPAAVSPGLFGNVGVDFMGLRVLADTRAEYRLMKYGESRWHLTYGALVSVDL